MQKTPDFMPSFRANLPRNSHVLSHDLGFTATFGHLNPVFHTVLSPGDTVNLGFDFNLRTMPLEAAAFADLVCHTEYFFVPMQLLYQPFDSVFYNISDQFSSLLSGSDIQPNLPLLDMSSIVDDLRTDRTLAAMTYGKTNLPVESIGQSSLRLLDLLGYDPRGLSYDGVSGQGLYYPNVFPYPIMAYNCIYQYYYRLDAREKFNQQTFNVDRFYSDSTPQSELLPHESFLMKYRPLDNDYFTDVKVSPIVDALNLNSNTFFAAQDWLSRNSDVSGVADSQNAGILTAFQQALGSGGSGTTGAITWSSTTPSGVVNLGSPVSANANILSFSSGNGVVQETNARSTTAIPSIITSDHTHRLSDTGASVINTANIRAMFAAEKLWSITGRAKKNYDEQTLAHFGFKVPHDVKHQISCFGHDISRVHIGEVISTANTELSPLGEIAGKGYGQQSGQRHKFTAPCHGVVMAIFSVTLQHNYEGGYLRANMVTGRNDFYIPEFDHLGMQPLFLYEAQFTEATDTNQGNILGWQYRYEQWKRRYNRTSGAFRNSTGSLKSWIPTFNPYCGPKYSSVDSGSTSNPPNTESYKSFLNLPTDGNQLFLAQYPSLWSTSFEGNDKWSAVYDNDPFVVNSHVDCVLVSTMSDYSLPRLDA